MSSPFDDPKGAAVSEIAELHDFIAAWFRGDADPATFETGFAARLHDAFENIQPAGRVLSRADLLEPIRAAHGTNPDFRIAIEAPRVIAAYPEAGLIMATYVEAQSGARNSNPPENRRRSTVLFEAQGARLIWRHLQETGLPG